MMDDHVVKWNKGLCYPAWYEREFRLHLRNAEKVFVISPAMQQFYRERFAVDSEVLFGPADLAGTPVYRSPTPRGPVTLAYFGSIWPWQRDALERLVPHLDRANATLDVFGFHDLPRELLSPRVRVCSAVPSRDVISRMREYDGIVIPAGFGDAVRNLSELNISTKLSECLACGTVPVVVAPEFAAMVKFTREHGGAVIVSDFDDPAQVAALQDLKSIALRQRVLDQARHVVTTQCSSDVMRHRWTQAWNVSITETTRPEPAYGDLAARAV
jgi:glycosyltransferase involved in cell wall biosynthesis